MTACLPCTRTLWPLLTATLLLFGCKRTEPLPVLGQLPEFQLTDQAGDPFGSRELAGTPYVATFMFTRCPSICPRVSARMRDVGNAAAGANLGLHLVSFSVDGEHDTPPVLRAYAEKHHLAAPLHVLLTGDSKDIAEQAERDFKIAVQGTIDLKAEHLGITHGSHLVLVDQTGRIRGYFRSSDDEAMAQLMIAIKQLSKE